MESQVKEQKINGHLKDETMATASRQEEKLDEVIKSLKDLTIVMQAKNGNGKSFGEKITQFLPSLVLILGMGWTVARTDASRQITLEAVQGQVQALQKTVDEKSSKLERMEKLYLIRFGEDPSSVDLSRPQPTKRR